MRIFLLTIGLVFILCSCANELVVNDEWRDNTIVYGLLNVKDSPNYVRINKAFLGETNAIEMAAISDSINYQNINVFLEEWKNGNCQKTILLQKTIEIQKDSGFFPTDNNVIYKINENLSAYSSYKLVIINLENGNEVTAETEMVGNFKIETPVLVYPIQFEKLCFFDKMPVEVKWRSAYYGRVYYVYINFYYTEILNGETTLNSIKYPLIPVISDESFISGWSPYAQLHTKIINTERFYKYIATSIESKKSVRRRFEYMNYEFVVGSDDFYSYLQVSELSTGIVQERPTYSNISNGVGLFTSRFNKTSEKKIMSGISIDSLSAGQYTKLLRFEDNNGVIH